jgi:hypothetical protein
MHVVGERSVVTMTGRATNANPPAYDATHRSSIEKKGDKEKLQTF